MSEPKPEVGHIVYLRHNLGDVNPDTKVRVTVPAGTPGTLVGYETRTQNYPDGKNFSWYYARVRIPPRTKARSTSPPTSASPTTRV